MNNSERTATSLTPMRMIATITLAIVLALTGLASPASAYEGDTYTDLIEDETLTDQHAIIIRFYAAVFGRTPDNDGVRYWLDQYDTGEWSTRRIANFFATGDEFVALYGEGTTNAEFVDSVYPNVLGRQPDAEGRAFWISFLDADNPRAEMILLVSNAPEFIEANKLPFEITPEQPKPDEPKPDEPKPDEPKPEPFASCRVDALIGDSEFRSFVEVGRYVQAPVTLTYDDCGESPTFSAELSWPVTPATMTNGGVDWICETGQTGTFSWAFTPIDSAGTAHPAGAESGSKTLTCPVAIYTTESGHDLEWTQLQCGEVPLVRNRFGVIQGDSGTLPADRPGCVPYLPDLGPTCYRQEPDFIWPDTSGWFINGERGLLRDAQPGDEITHIQGHVCLYTPYTGTVDGEEVTTEFQEDWFVEMIWTGIAPPALPSCPNNTPLEVLIVAMRRGDFSELGSEGLDMEIRAEGPIGNWYGTETPVDCPTIIDEPAWSLVLQSADGKRITTLATGYDDQLTNGRLPEGFDVSDHDGYRIVFIPADDDALLVIYPNVTLTVVEDPNGIPMTP